MHLYRLLIADDEEIIRIGLSRTVDWKSLGFRLVGAVANGQQALEFIERNEVDVLLADIRMPKLSGLELARCLADRRPNLQVVILSGCASFPYAKEAIEYGVFSYILKPSKSEDIEAVFSRLKAQLDIRRASAVLDSLPTAEKDAEFDTPPKRSIALALDLIERYYADDLSLESVASRVGLSPSYFSRLFKKETGQNFKDYLILYRLRKAKMALLDPRRKIYEVAEDSGFRDQRYFSEVFKKHFGLSPLEFRDHPV